MAEAWPCNPTSNIVAPANFVISKDAPDRVKMYRALVEAYRDAKAIERIEAMEGPDVGFCKDCGDELDLKKEKSWAVADALAKLLEIRCCNHERMPMLTAGEIADLGCQRCKAKVVLEV